MVAKKTPRPRKAATTPGPSPAAPAADARPTAPKPKRARKTAAKPAVPERGREVTDEEIRVRAYFLALEYQGSDRADVDFWLAAERELRGGAKKAR